MDAITEVLREVTLGMAYVGIIGLLWVVLSWFIGAIEIDIKIRKGD